MFLIFDDIRIAWQVFINRNLVFDLRKLFIEKMEVDPIRRNNIPLFVNLLYLIPLNVCLIFVKIFKSVP